jgi:hypothetical protein
MNKPEPPLAPVAKTLAQQKSDFTAEGSPPPGNISTSVPASSPDPQGTTPPQATARATARATIKLKRPPTKATP